MEEADVGEHEPKNACATCGGKGSVTVNLDNKEQTIPCGACNGTGQA